MERRRGGGSKWRGGGSRWRGGGGRWRGGNCKTISTQSIRSCINIVTALNRKYLQPDIDPSHHQCPHLSMKPPSEMETSKEVSF